MLVLGLETSCDDTGVGIVDGNSKIHANIVASQLTAHRPYGGVVPEIAARAHLDVIDHTITAALREAGIGLKDISGVAATTGPGLIGGVMVGSMMGKAIAAVRGLPFIAVNHLEAHALTARLTDNIDFPYLLLLVSGGHTQLLLVQGVGRYRLIGRTIDDAVGECFDKCAKMLGLGYPGGPLIEEAARNGNPETFALPRPMRGRDNCDFSFSGLKTAVRTSLERANADLSEGATHSSLVADMAASLQVAIADSLVDRVEKAFLDLQKTNENVRTFVVAGGVAANQTLRGRLEKIAHAHAIKFAAPPPRLCTDNGVMVAWAGVERLRLGMIDELSTPARPRWPLDDRA